MADPAPFSFREDWTIRGPEYRAHYRAVHQLLEDAKRHRPEHRKRFSRHPILSHEGPEQTPHGTTAAMSASLVADIFGNYNPNWRSGEAEIPGEQDPSDRARLSPMALPLTAGMRGVAEGDAWTGPERAIATHPEVRRELRSSGGDPRVRFAKHVRLDGDCALWTGATRNGYPIYKAAGRTVDARRWAYEQAHGSIPDGMALRVTCGAAACVAISHVRLESKSASLRRWTDAAVAVGS